MPKRAFGQLELDILYILKSGNRMTIKDVLNELGGEDKYTTIMTIMNRLVEKKLIARERMGLHYEYWTISTQPKHSSLLENFKQKIFGVKTVAMVNYLIESASDMTDEDIAEMERMIEKAKAKRKRVQ